MPRGSILLDPALSQAPLPEDFFQLSFGIEIEFLVAYERTPEYLKEFEEANPEDPTGSYADAREPAWNLFMRNKIRKHLQNGRVPVFEENAYEQNSSNYSKWDVVHDETLNKSRVPAVALCQFLACIKLISPALVVRREAMSHIEKVLNLVSGGFDIKINSTCDFHVHLSNSGRQFLPNTIRNLGMIQAVFDRQLNSLHRRSQIRKEWCRTPSRVWSTHCRTRAGRHHWLSSIPHDMLELRMLILTLNPGYGKGAAFNYGNLHNRPGPGSKTTIEFRQHVATFDPTAVIAWLEFVSKMVLYANGTPQKDMETFASRHGIKDPSEYTVIHLMQSLNVSDFAIDFYRYRLHTHTDEVDPREQEDYDHIHQKMERMRNILAPDGIDPMPVPDF